MDEGDTGENGDGERGGDAKGEGVGEGGGDTKVEGIGEGGKIEEGLEEGDKEG